MRRDSFVFYRSFYDVAQMLPTEKERITMLLAVITLGLEDTIDEKLPLEMRTALKQMQASIVGAKNRHDIAVKNGKNGGAPKGNQNARKKKNNQNNLNVNDNVNDNANDNVNDNVNDNSITSPDMALPKEGQSVDGDDGDWTTGKEIIDGNI